REAMRTPAWLRTARPSAFVAVTMAGWPRWSLTFGSSLTQVRILAGEGCVRDQSRAGPCESCSLVVLVLCTSDATDRGAGIFLDVVDDLDRSGLLEHQRTLDLLANRERLLEAEQHDAKRAGLELDGLAGLDLDAVGERARLGHAVHIDHLVHLDLARRRRGASDQAIRGLSLVGDGEIAARNVGVFRGRARPGVTDVEGADLELVRAGRSRNEQTRCDKNSRCNKHKDISDYGCHNVLLRYARWTVKACRETIRRDYGRC